jgi:hypothetical protein
MVRPDLQRDHTLERAAANQLALACNRAAAGRAIPPPAERLAVDAVLELGLEQVWVDPALRVALLRRISLVLFPV